MGERFRTARLEAGLSQTQLCQGVVSRNMLSQIESGTAKPSLSTLEILAERLQKPVGYFFGEESESLSIRNQAENAWKAFYSGKDGEVLQILDSSPELEQYGDISLLKAMALLNLAEKALAEDRNPYAKELLHRARQEKKCSGTLKRRMLLLQGRLEGQKADPVCRELPDLDGELMLRARGAMERGDPERAAQYLEAAENKNFPDWQMLRGKIYLSQGHYKSAARCFHGAETSMPQETCPYLEQCYREMGNFKQAYFYACRQK